MKHYNALLAGLLASTSTFGSTTPTGTPAMEQVIVSATRSPQLALNVSMPITVITAEDIATSGAAHLIDVLSSQAGIQVQDKIGNGSRGAISMRGFADSATNNTLILVDGRKLNNPTLEAADLNSIPVGDIERIEIVQGSAGVLFGEQAVGGVINIITRRPDEQQVRIESFIGSHELEGGRVTVSQGFDNGLAYRVSTEKKQSDNYRDNNESDYSNAIAQVDYRRDWGSVFAEFQSIHDDLNLPGSISTQQAATDRKQTNNPNDFFDTRTDVARIGGTLKLTDALSLAAEYSDRDSDGTGFQFGADFSQDTRVRTFSPRLLGQWDTSNGPLLLTMGYDQQDSTFDYKQPGFFYFLSNEQRIKDVYAQAVIPLAKNLSLTTGARHSKANDENFINALENDESEVATEIGLSWQITPAHRVFLRNADGFRFATVDENSLTPPGQAFLDPQTSNSWDLGYEWSRGRHGIKALAYDMQLDNEIIYDPFIPNVWFPGANINLDESSRRGLILDGTLGISDRVLLRANYTYTDAEITSGAFKGNAVPFVAEHTGTVAIEWAILDTLSVYLDGQYTGSRYPANDDGNTASKIADYWVYNANVRWTPGAWDINARLNNLSGEQYNSYESLFGVYPAAESTVELRVAYTF